MSPGLSPGLLEPLQLQPLISWPGVDTPRTRARKPRRGQKSPFAHHMSLGFWGTIREGSQAAEEPQGALAFLGGRRFPGRKGHGKDQVCGGRG